MKIKITSEPPLSDLEENKTSLLTTGVLLLKLIIDDKGNSSNQLKNPKDYFHSVVFIVELTDDLKSFTIDHLLTDEDPVLVPVMENASLEKEIENIANVLKRDKSVMNLGNPVHLETLYVGNRSELFTKAANWR